MKFFLLLALLVSSFSLLPAGEVPARIFQCPMHPWIKSDHPGKCTICGMALVAASSALDAPSGVITLSPSQITTIGVETSTVARQSLTRTLRVTGRIDDDDTRHRILSARVPGRVEKLFVNYIGAEVAAGAPLVTLFSPEVLTAQRIFVERVRGEAAFPAAERSAARERLIELGLADSDIATLEKNLTPSAIVNVRAPSAGTVVAKSVYEGQYVQASDRLLELADFSRMWFVFDAYAQDIPWLHAGQSVEITTRAVPGETIIAPIDFIDPNFDEQRQTARVRAVLPNPHFSTGGQPHSLPHRVLAEGRVLVESPAVLAAPRSAVLDRGAGPVAYVATEANHYEQRRLTLGRRGDGLVEILSGLAEGDKVVTHGALLIDAQAQLATEASTATVTPPSQLTDLTLLANAAISSAAALSADDYAAYRKIFPTLDVAAKNFPALPKLELGADLRSARRSFEPWSTAAADLLKPHRAHLGFKIFECPMAPILGKGRWVQRGEPLKNPFFGSAMADCGSEVP